MTDRPSPQPEPEYTPHPFTEIFPPMSDEERGQLEKSIKENGLREKILIDKLNRILDGLNRYRACLAVGVQPEFEVFSGTEDEAIALIWDRNVVRRHLSTSQKAAIGAEWAQLKRGQRKSGNSSISTADIAKKLNISESLINTEKAVMRASPELHAAVKADKVSVNAAEAAAIKAPEAERAARIREVLSVDSKKAARGKAKAAATSHAVRAPRPTPSSKGKGTKLHGAFAALLEELDLLPGLLDKHKPSSDTLEELKSELRKALVAIITAERSRQNGSGEDKS